MDISPRSRSNISFSEASKTPNARMPEAAQRKVQAANKDNIGRALLYKYSEINSGPNPGEKGVRGLTVPAYYGATSGIAREQTLPKPVSAALIEQVPQLNAYPICYDVRGDGNCGITCMLFAILLGVENNSIDKIKFTHAINRLKLTDAEEKNPLKKQQFDASKQFLLKIINNNVTFVEAIDKLRNPEFHKALCNVLRKALVLLVNENYKENKKEAILSEISKEFGFLSPDTLLALGSILQIHTPIHIADYGSEGAFINSLPSANTKSDVVILQLADQENPTNSHFVLLSRRDFEHEFAQGKTLSTLTKEDCTKFLAAVDEKSAENVDHNDWLALMDSVFLIIENSKNATLVASALNKFKDDLENSTNLSENAKDSKVYLSTKLPKLNQLLAKLSTVRADDSPPRTAPAPSTSTSTSKYKPGSVQSFTLDLPKVADNTKQFEIDFKAYFLELVKTDQDNITKITTRLLSSVHNFFIGKPQNPNYKHKVNYQVIFNNIKDLFQINIFTRFKQENKDAIIELFDTIKPLMKADSDSDEYASAEDNS